MWGGSSGHAPGPAPYLISQPSVFSFLITAVPCDMQGFLLPGGFCIHSDPTGLEEMTSQHSFCTMVLALGNWTLV